MEVAPFFVDFHHFLSIFTIFYQFSQLTHFCRDLHFVTIYALFPQIFWAKIAFSATSHIFCMYAPGNLCRNLYASTLNKNYISFVMWNCVSSGVFRKPCFPNRLCIKSTLLNNYLCINSRQDQAGASSSIAPAEWILGQRDHSCRDSYYFTLIQATFQF